MLRGSPSLTPCFCWSTHSTCNLIAPAPASFFPTVLTILSLYSKQSSAPTIDFFLEVSKVNKAQFTWPDTFQMFSARVCLLPQDDWWCSFLCPKWGAGRISLAAFLCEFTFPSLSLLHCFL